MNASNKIKCDKKLKIANKKNITIKVDNILNNQDKRLQFIKERYKRYVRFGFMRSKTKYGEKALKSALSYAISSLSSLKYVPNYLNKTNTRLTNILNSIDINNKDKINLLMDNIDLGYRMRYRNDPLTVLINLIMFGFIMVNDWQFYLSTPLAIKLLSDAFNGDIKQQEELVKIFINVSCNGVSPSDILSFVPKIPGLDICDKNHAYYWLLDKGLRQTVYRASLYTECPKKIINSWVIESKNYR